MTGAALFGATGFTAYPHGGNKSLTPNSLLGLLVRASNGTEVGKIVGISTALDGRIERIRVATASKAGFGQRHVIIPQPAFRLRRRAIVLDLSPEDLRALPTAMTHDGAAE